MDRDDRVDRERADRARAERVVRDRERLTPGRARTERDRPAERPNERPEERLIDRPADLPNEPRLTLCEDLPRPRRCADTSPHIAKTRITDNATRTVVLGLVIMSRRLSVRFFGIVARHILNVDSFSMLNNTSRADIMQEKPQIAESSGDVIKLENLWDIRETDYRPVTAAVADVVDSVLTVHPDRREADRRCPGDVAV